MTAATFLFGWLCGVWTVLLVGFVLAMLRFLTKERDFTKPRPDQPSHVQVIPLEDSAPDPTWGDYN